MKEKFQNLKTRAVSLSNRALNKAINLGSKAINKLEEKRDISLGKDKIEEFQGKCIKYCPLPNSSPILMKVYRTYFSINKEGIPCATFQGLTFEGSTSKSDEYDIYFQFDGVRDIDIRIKPSQKLEELLTTQVEVIDPEDFKKQVRAMTETAIIDITNHLEHV